jgi:DNA polymerase III epsilon subunit-like protein
MTEYNNNEINHYDDGVCVCNQARQTNEIKSNILFDKSKIVKIELKITHIKSIKNPIFTTITTMSIKRVLVFDTETNGLLPARDKKTQLPIICEYPYILQLSFVLYNLESGIIEETYNNYIKVSDDVIISNKITEITGITKEICMEKGVPITNALYEFYHAYMLSDRIIAHNISFDKNMLELEIFRNREHLRSIPESYFLFNDMFNSVHNIDTYCTMTNTKQYCNIMINGRYGPFKKAPKLVELHDKLFEFTPTNLHDAMIDTLVCLKCYLKHVHERLLPDKIDEYLKSGGSSSDYF